MENTKRVQVVNLLHHPIDLIRPDGSTLSIEPSGESVRTLRLKTWDMPVVVGECLGFPIIERDKGVVNTLSLLNRQEGLIYIVSTMVAREMCSPQFISPNTLDPTQVVKEGKRIVGVRSFQTFRRSDGIKE